MTKESAGELIYFFMMPGCILSIFGCLFVILLYSFVKPLRMYAFKLVFWLAFYDFLKFTCLLVPNFEIESNIVCTIVGFVYYYSNYSTFIWTLAIAVTLYQYLILEIENIEIYYKYWQIFCFLYSAICSSIPLFTHTYGKNLFICELLPDLYGTIYKFSFFYVPVFLILIVITYVYVRIYYKFTVRTSAFENARELSVKRLLAYPLIMAVCLMPGITMNILEIFWGVENNTLILIVMVIWDMHGFFNAVAYSLTRPVTEYLKSIFLNRTSSIYNQMNTFDLD